MVNLPLWLSTALTLDTLFMSNLSRGEWSGEKREPPCYRSRADIHREDGYQLVSYGWDQTQDTKQINKGFYLSLL